MGFRKNSFDFFDKISIHTVIENKVIIYDTEQKFTTYTDYKNRHFQDAEFIDVDYNNLVENDGSQLFFDNQKSIALSKFGYSKLAYTHMKQSIDSWFLLCNNDDHCYRTYTTARNINLYYEYKLVIYEIFENSIKDKSVASLGSGHWERDSWEREQEKGSWESYCYGNNVVSLQVNTAGIMAMNRMDRIVLDPVRTYACTRTARTDVRVTVPLSL